MHCYMKKELTILLCLLTAGTSVSAQKLTDHVNPFLGTATLWEPEDLGYVRRETDPTDRRQNNLTLTESGRALAPLIRSYLGEWSSTIAADLTSEERDTLLTLLHKLLRPGS